MTTQTLERAINLMRLLASAGHDGSRLADLQRDTGLTKPTVHRILDTLKGEGFVEQVEDTRRYRLGNELAVLGWSAGRTVYDLKDLTTEDVTSVATKTGDTSYLAIRSGNEAVVIDRQTGSYPVKAFTVEVGARRPLGVGATGIALLAALQPDAAEVVLDAIASQLANYPNTGVKQVREAVAAARKAGYALSDGFMVKGVRGLAITIGDGEGRTIAAIGTAAISDRMTARRIPEILKILKMHANSIEQRVVAASSRARHGSTRTVVSRR